MRKPNVVFPAERGTVYLIFQKAFACINACIIACALNFIAKRFCICRKRCFVYRTAAPSIIKSAAVAHSGKFIIIKNRQINRVASQLCEQLLSLLPCLACVYSLRIPINSNGKPSGSCAAYVCFKGSVVSCRKALARISRVAQADNCIIHSACFHAFPINIAVVG